MTSYAVRTATPADVDALLAFWAHAAEGTSITDDRDGVARLVAWDPEAVLIAYPASGPGAAAIAGTVIAGFDGWRCHLYRLAVDPARRRQGIGRLLLDAAEERFTRLGGRRGDAMVLDHNELGRSAWAAQGYAPEPQWTRWTKPLKT